MKRVVSSSIIAVIVLIIIAGSFLYLQFRKADDSSVFEMVPADVAWMVAVNPAAGDLQRLARSSFFNGADTVEPMLTWKKSLLHFDSLCVNNQALSEIFKSTSLYITGHVTGPSSFSLMYFVQLKPDQLTTSTGMLNALFAGGGERRKRIYNGVEIKEYYRNDSLVFSWTHNKGVFIGSSTSFLVEDALRQQKDASRVSPARDIRDYMSGRNKDFLVAVHYNGFARWVKTQFRDPSSVSMLPLERLGRWSVMKMDMHETTIQFAGETMVSDSSSFMYLFKDQQPVSRKLVQLLPAKTVATVVWGFHDSGRFLKDVKRSLPADSVKAPETLSRHFTGWMGQELALVVTQPVKTLTDNNFLALLSVTDSASCLRSLGQLASDPVIREEYYNGYYIRYLPGKNIMSAVFGPLFNRVSRFYFSYVNGVLVVGNQAAVIRSYINDVKTGNFLKEEDKFKHLLPQIPEKGNLLFYGNVPQSERIFTSVAAPSWVTWLAQHGAILKNWNGLTFSVSNKDGVYQTSGCLGYYDKNQSGPKLMWNLQLDTVLRSGPLCPSGSTDLAFVEDVSQQLYAIGPDGSVKWKRKLDTPLLGEVEMVDLYGNGNRQFLFNTMSFVYLVDSAGNDAGKYPFRLPAQASSGLTLLPPSDQVEIRYIIPCANLRMYAYGISGQPAEGVKSIRLPEVLSTLRWLPGSRLVLCTTAGKRGFLLNEKLERVQTVGGEMNLKYGQSIFCDTLNEAVLFSYLDEAGNLFSINKEGVQTALSIAGQDSIYAVHRTDINGDERPDWLLAGSRGLTFTTDDGVTLYRFNPGSPVAGVGSVRLNGKTMVLAQSANLLYGFSRDGLMLDGFPVPAMALPVECGVSSPQTVLMTLSTPSQISGYLMD